MGPRDSDDDADTSTQILVRERGSETDLFRLGSALPPFAIILTLTLQHEKSLRQGTLWTSKALTGARGVLATETIRTGDIVSLPLDNSNTDEKAWPAADAFVPSEMTK